jgi:hypothetical protein
MNTSLESMPTQSQQSPKPSGQLATSEQQYTRMLNHLVQLCSQKGFKQYGWERAKELERNQFELFDGLTIDLAKQMKEKNAQTKE